MGRNGIILALAVLAVATVVLGTMLYQERNRGSGVDITIGNRGVSIRER